MRIIDSSAITEIRAAFGANRYEQVAPALVDKKFSLGGMLEAAAWIVVNSETDKKGTALLLAIDHVRLKRVCSLLTSAEGPSLRLNAKGTASIRAVTALDSSDRKWMEYLMEFHSALVVDGFEKAYAKALSYSFHEMADNVRQHATEKGNGSVEAVAGWHVTDGVAAFAVVDLGRGIKASLRTNPKWGHLKSDRDALLAVLHNRATRKAGNIFGDGFNDVVRNFVSRNGCLALRSGDTELVASGTITEGAVRAITAPIFQGTRAAARCAPLRRVVPVEPPLENQLDQSHVIS